MQVPSPLSAGSCGRWVALTQVDSFTMMKCQNRCAWHEHRTKRNSMGTSSRNSPRICGYCNCAELPPGRLWSYETLHLRSPLCKHPFQPSPYPRAQVPYQLKILRLRTQTWLDHIPTHMYFCRSGHRPSYSQRHCTLCPGSVLGDETHIYY